MRISKGMREKDSMNQKEIGQLQYSTGIPPEAPGSILMAQISMMTKRRRISKNIDLWDKPATLCGDILAL
ncbi:hypothetical protein [Anaerohalosphaera lusitana]|uniref:hypothetical protein n=1 Tax=Anaerohalosphaera lusitana TaxID=1936003 RepID=UPI001475C6FF|nr:hypothetical protein [Anaerohalosphaera lusitana]